MKAALLALAMLACDPALPPAAVVEQLRPGSPGGDGTMICIFHGGVLRCVSIR